MERDLLSTRKASCRENQTRCRKENPSSGPARTSDTSYCHLFPAIPGTPSPRLPRVPRAAVPALSSIRMGIDLGDLASVPSFLWASVSPRAPDLISLTNPGHSSSLTKSLPLGHPPLRKALAPHTGAGCYLQERPRPPGERLE